MKTFIIYDATREGTPEKITEIQAGNGRNALKKFQSLYFMNANLYEIRRVIKNCWEMSGHYGNYFYAIKKEEE